MGGKKNINEENQTVPIHYVSKSYFTIFYIINVLKSGPEYWTKNCETESLITCLIQSYIKSKQVKKQTKLDRSKLF